MTDRRWSAFVPIGVVGCCALLAGAGADQGPSGQPPQSEPAPNAANETYAHAASLFGEGQDDEALAALDDLLRQDRKNVRALALRGEILMRLGRFEEAHSAYRDALRERPDSALLHHRLGAALMALRRPGPAAAEFRRALRAEPTVERRLALVDACCAQGKYDEALTTLAEEEADPDNPRILGARGAILILMHQDEQAATILEAAIENNPEDANLRFQLGIALEHLNRAPEAISAWEEAIRLDPDHRDAHKNLGILLHAKNRFQEAIPHYQTYVRLGGDDPKVLEFLERIGQMPPEGAPTGSGGR